MDNNLLYSMTNSATNNEVIAFKINSSGQLIQDKVYSTEGKGTGQATVDPLISQGSILISREFKLLFVVNPGSNSISTFKILPNGDLKLTSVVYSNGIMPVALAQDSNLLAVANRGNTLNKSNISKFIIDSCGYLTPCYCSITLLSNPTSQPTSLAINPITNQLLTSELNFGRISVFSIDRKCSSTCPVVNNSANPNSFALAYLHNGIILSCEVGSNMLSSYLLNSDNTLSVINSVSTSGNASCWVVATPDNKYAYVSNTASGTISAFSISISGILTFINTTPSNPNGTSAPIDSCINSDGKYFYVLNGDTGSISRFEINNDGTLNFIELLNNTTLPGPGAQGLACL